MTSSNFYVLLLLSALLLFNVLSSATSYFFTPGYTYDYIYHARIDILGQDNITITVPVSYKYQLIHLCYQYSHNFIKIFYCDILL